MNAPIAKPEVTTPRTFDTATATPAVSTTALRIDDFIKAQFSKSKEESFSGVKSSADRLARLGFKSSANSRYADFLEAFRSTPLLSASYAERYPNCCFLPWKAFHAVRRSLDVWCDLPEFYAGAVPEEQIPWMEIFELDPADLPQFSDFQGILEIDPNDGDRRREEFMRSAWGQESLSFPEISVEHRLLFSQAEYQFSRDAGFLQNHLRPMRESFFVVAPKEAFTTRKDYITRLREMVTASIEPTVAPNDPLVIRFVRGGALVIAAWGDEAAELNQITRDLGI